MKVFVTGGTGLLGSHVAERLRGAGHGVVALHRPGSDTAHLRALGCVLVEGDLQDAAAVHARRMDGCDALFHAAGHLYGGASLDAVRAANVAGARAVLEGARAAGLARAVHVSSVAVYGNAPAPVREDTPFSPLRPSDLYGRTKREGEAVAASLDEPGGFRVTVLRPPALWGERDRLFTLRMAALLRRPVTFLLGSGRTRLSAVYAGNLAQAVERALAGCGEGGTFNVSEDVVVTQRTFLSGLAATLGLHPRFLSLPAAPARVAARVGEALGLGVPGAADLSLVRTVRLATEDNPYDATRARAELGWTPPFALQEALSRTGTWLRSF